MRDGETIDSFLNLTDSGDNEQHENANVILLTNARVIYVILNGNETSTNFAALESIDGVEVTSEGKGYMPYVWGILGVIAAFMIWRVWENPIGSLISAILVVLMGSYLVFDHMTSSRTKQLIFKTRSFQFHCNLQYDKPDRDIYRFIDRLFHLRELWYHKFSG